jgi:uncharacterized damage-inducible protein DinB
MKSRSFTVKEVPVRIVPLALVFVWLATASALAQDPSARPASAATAINKTWSGIQRDFISAADAMPEEKYSFVPTQGTFKGARSFAEQVQHVACANFAFFKEFSGVQPNENCHRDKWPRKTKVEIMKYLRDSFQFADQAIAVLSTENALDKVEGPYGGPSTKLGITVLAVWHASDHYGQIVEYLRMNGIVPPASR